MAPSAGARYPLEVSVVVGTPGVEDLETGVYRYRPVNHELVREDSTNVQSALRRATLDQENVEDAADDIVLWAVEKRVTRKYGEWGRTRYVPMESGHVGENLYLQAEVLDLATVSIGAFDDDRLREVVGIPTANQPLYVFPVGR